MDKSAIDRQIEASFSEFPPKLRQAARYAIDNPKDIALQSMRAVAQRAGVQAGVMLRLARQLGFENYDAFRACYRIWMEQGDAPFSGRLHGAVSKAS